MSFTILDLPIEPIESRYSTQWAKWFRAAYQRNNITAYTIIGTGHLPPNIDKFLDPFGTFVWKFSQLYKTVDFINRWDSDERNKGNRLVVFLHDGWMPGIECFPYIADLAGVDVQVCGFFHAGSWDPSDLLGRADCDRWARGSETSWLSMCKKIFLGSEYHARMIDYRRPKAHLSIEGKVYVTGCPVEVPKLDLTKKEPIVVWPHRISPDKSTNHCEHIRRVLAARHPEVQFIRTMDEPRSKDDYYQLLARSKVAISTALHENFGISMVEAAMLGCYPICPDRLSYKETMEDHWRYENDQQFISLIELGLRQTEPYEYPYKDLYNQVTVTDKIVNALAEVGNA